MEKANNIEMSQSQFIKLNYNDYLDNDYMDNDFIHSIEPDIYSILSNSNRDDITKVKNILLLLKEGKIDNNQAKLELLQLFKSIVEKLLDAEHNISNIDANISDIMSNTSVDLIVVINQLCATHFTKVDDILSTVSSINSNSNILNANLNLFDAVVMTLFNQCLKHMELINNSQNQNLLTNDIKEFEQILYVIKDKIPDNQDYKLSAVFLNTPHETNQANNIDDKLVAHNLILQQIKNSTENSSDLLKNKLFELNSKIDKMQKKVSGRISNFKEDKKGEIVVSSSHLSVMISDCNLILEELDNELSH